MPTTPGDYTVTSDPASYVVVAGPAVPGGICYSTSGKVHVDQFTVATASLHDLGAVGYTAPISKLSMSFTIHCIDSDSQNAGNLIATVTLA